MATSNVLHESLSLSVVTPYRSLYEGKVDSVVVPSHDGQMGIMPGHATLMGLLGHGILHFRGVDGEKSFVIDGGFVEVNNNRVTVLANNGENLDGVDRSAAEAALQEALNMPAVGDFEIEERFNRQDAARSRLYHAS